MSMGKHSKPGAQTFSAPCAKLQMRAHCVPRPVLMQMCSAAQAWLEHESPCVPGPDGKQVVPYCSTSQGPVG